MDRYTLHEHYQKRMNIIVDRFQKQVALTILLFTGFVWSLFNADESLKPHLMLAGLMTLATMFFLIGIAGNGARKAAQAVQIAFKTDYESKFNEAPDQILTGLFV